MMSHLDKILALWNKTEGNLAEITTELIKLLDTAHDDGETIPYSLELEIVLQANYSLGYGSSTNEIYSLARLMLGILDDQSTLNIIDGKKLKETSNDETLGKYPVLAVPKLHRLGCTLASSLISHLTSLQYLEEGITPGLVPWSTDDSDPQKVLDQLVIHLLELLVLGEPNDWSLELITFITSILLILSDLGHPHTLSEKHHNTITSVLRQLEGTIVYQKWKEDWLEKSDYYRFVTLMLTSTVREEEVWLDFIQSFV